MIGGESSSEQVSFEREGEQENVVERWRDIISSLVSVYSEDEKIAEILSRPEYREARQDYLQLVEKCYGEFVAQYGPVEPQSLKEFMLTRKNFLQYLEDSSRNKHPEPQPIYYDIGYQFLVDSLLNGNSDIGTVDREYFREYFQELAPYYNHSYFVRQRATDDLLAHYSDKEVLVELVRKLLFRGESQYLVSRGDQQINASNSQWREIDADTPTSDATWNPNMTERLWYVLGQLGFDFDECDNIRETAREHYAKEFFAEFADISQDTV